mgnify:CR=1 FL=1
MELKHAILGMLSITPLSGYDLNRAFVGSVAHFWHADQSQIYRTLDRLAADGAIKTKGIRQSGKPDRKVHSLTPEGRRELRRWLTSPRRGEGQRSVHRARLFRGLPQPRRDRTHPRRTRAAGERKTSIAQSPRAARGRLAVGPPGRNAAQRSPRRRSGADVDSRDPRHPRAPLAAIAAGGFDIPSGARRRRLGRRRPSAT